MPRLLWLWKEKDIEPKSRFHVRAGKPLACFPYLKARAERQEKFFRECHEMFLQEV